MKAKQFRVGGEVIVALLVAALVGGCATPGVSEEQVVEKRAAERWKAVVAGDLKRAYGYISPAGRSSVSFEAYEKSVKRGFHRAARVQEVRCASEVCDVTLEVEYEYAGRGIKTPLLEKWVRQDSDWWYMYQR